MFYLDILIRKKNSMTRPKNCLHYLLKKRASGAFIVVATVIELYSYVPTTELMQLYQ